MSPLNRRRWQNFKANRRGYWSFWIFLVLFGVSLFAEFIANDKPFYIRYDGKSYFPIFFTYPETTFGGDFETPTDYRDPYVQKQIAAKGGTMVWPPIRYSYDTHNLDLPTPAPAAYWNFCADPAGYYPYVQTCATRWIRTVPTSMPLAPPPPVPWPG